MGAGALLEGVWSLGEGHVLSLSCVCDTSMLGSGSLPFLQVNT